MLTNRIFSAAAGLALATAFATGSYASTNRSFPSKAKTYDITFDGYCDGMNLTISQKVDVVGPSTGCYAGFVNEGFTATRSGVKFLDVTSNAGGAGAAMTYVFDDPRGPNRGWCNYYTTDGISQNQLKCGTYTVNAPGPRGSQGSADKPQ